MYENTCGVEEGACDGVEGFKLSRVVDSWMLVTLCCLDCFMSQLSYHWLEGGFSCETLGYCLKSLMVRRDWEVMIPVFCEE